ncbi:YbjQ family protein [Candidatus Sumerlaeota bacterium]|nr:YbjQ family protein [Candidatus Sumerlaeota bacterium]
MLITTQDELSGYEITETLGLVKGNTVRARHIGKDILAGFRNVVGGEIDEYTKLLAESREQSIDRMIEDARRLGADGIVCVRFTTSSIMQAAAELFVYGTAVKLKAKKVI